MNFRRVEHFFTHFFPDQCWSGEKVRTKVFNWSEVHLYRSNFYKIHILHTHGLLRFRIRPPRLTLMKRTIYWFFGKCISSLFNCYYFLFFQIVTSSYTDFQDYTYYFVPAPWLSVKLLRLLQNYPPPGKILIRNYKQKKITFH